MSGFISDVLVFSSAAGSTLQQRPSPDCMMNPSAYCVNHEASCMCRWVKSPAELQCMRQAATTSAHAIEQCMRACRPGLREYQLQSLFGEASMTACSWLAQCTRHDICPVACKACALQATPAVLCACMAGTEEVCLQSHGPHGASCSRDAISCCAYVAEPHELCRVQVQMEGRSEKCISARGCLWTRCHHHPLCSQ